MSDTKQGGVVVGGFGGLQGLPAAARARIIERHRVECEAKGFELVEAGPDDWLIVQPARKEVPAAA